MAAIFSEYLEQKILDHVLNGVTYTPPTQVYLALYTTTGEGGTEVTGGSYQRQPVSFSAALSSGQVSNDATVTFTNMPACTVKAAAFCDSLSGGNQLFWWNLSSNITYAAGNDPTISPGNLTVILD